MSDIDTSAETIKRLIAGTNGIPAFAPHNATLRALLAERDEAIQRGNDWCDQARRARAKRDHARKAVEMVIGDTAAELGCAPDNEAILKAIAALKAERDRLREALQKIAEGWAMDALDMQHVARAALKETAHD